MSSSSQDRATRWIAAALGLTTVSALGLAITYVRGGDTQIEGVLLAAALGGLATALILTAHHLLPQGPVTEQREPLRSTDEERAAFVDDFEAFAEGDAPLARRRFLLRMFAAAGSALGIAALFPIASLGPNIDRVLRRTKWTRGARLVDSEGNAVTVDTLKVGGVLTVFPEGHRNAASSQTLLIRVGTSDLTTRPGRDDWAPRGYVAYSKICTHAGCPVGLYEEQSKQLLCPCHQSTFTVLDGARPVFGPAARPLPQLPLRIDTNGYLRAQSDYHEPVGPGFWDRGR